MHKHGYMPRYDEDWMKRMPKKQQEHTDTHERTQTHKNLVHSAKYLSIIRKIIYVKSPVHCLTLQLAMINCMPMRVKRYVNLSYVASTRRSIRKRTMLKMSLNLCVELYLSLFFSFTLSSHHWYHWKIGASILNRYRFYYMCCTGILWMTYFVHLNRMKMERSWLTNISNMM